MTVYFDKANLEVFAGRKSEAMYPDCLRMVQRDLDKSFNFSKDELKANADLMAWYQTNMASNVGATNIAHSSAPFPPRPLKSNTPNTFSATQLSSLYLLNDDRMDAFKSTSSILAGKPGECIETLSPLFLGNNNYRFERKFSISDKAAAGTPPPPGTFCEWAQLKEITTPLTDILIVDPYIASSKDLIEFNLKPLLTQLSARCQTAINVVVYTTGNKMDVTYDVLRTCVLVAIKQATGKQGTFTLVAPTHVRALKSYAEHDRTILTNYIRVYSGDSFNYWLSDGTKETKGQEVSFSSLADPDNGNLSQLLIAKLQANLDKLPDHLITGDKKSGFFTFK